MDKHQTHKKKVQILQNPCLAYLLLASFLYVSNETRSIKRILPHPTPTLIKNKLVKGRCIKDSETFNGSTKYKNR